VFDPSAFGNPDVAEEDLVVDAAVCGSAEPSFLLADVHRRAGLENTMRERSGNVDVAGSVISLAEGVRPIHRHARE
jgi:hypothetical protein